MRLTRTSITLISLAAALCIVTQQSSAPQQENQWPATGALYEVNLDYFPNHSFRELGEMMPRLADLGVKVIYLLPIWETMGSQ